MRVWTSATILMLTRLVCMGIGLLTLPILLSGLGRNQFAAFSLLLGGGLLFYNFELAMPPTVVKFLAAVSEDKHAESPYGDGIDAVLTNAILLMGGLYLLGFLLVAATAGPVAAWLRLPDTGLLTAPNLIRFVFIAVTLNSLLKLSVSALHAVQRFGLVSGIEFAQILLASAFSGVAAIWWNRLDWTVVIYWASQLVVLAVAHLVVHRVTPWQFRLKTVNWRLIRRLMRHGFNLQIGDLIFFMHFQFDKMIISGMVGLSEVAHYEVNSRAGVSLRNLPVAAYRALLPAATLQAKDPEAFWRSYIDSTRIAGLGIIFFLLGPLIVSQLFLFAWVGQIGYHGRWVFFWLALGLMANVLCMPASIHLQAEGHTVLDRKCALIAIVINVVTTLLLVSRWGKVGAAAGTGLGVFTGSVVYLFLFHRRRGRRIGQTAGALWHILWPVLPVCLVWWLLTEAVKPFVIVSRWYMGPAAVVLYGSFVLAAATVFFMKHRFYPAELAVLTDTWNRLRNLFRHGFHRFR